MALTAAQRRRLVSELQGIAQAISEARELATAATERRGYADARIDVVISVPAVKNMTAAERDSALAEALAGLGYDPAVSPGMAADLASLSADVRAEIQARIAL